LALGVAAGAAICVGTYFLERLRRAGLFQVIVFDWKPFPSDKVIMFKPYKGAYHKDIRPAVSEVLELIGNTKCQNKEMWNVYYDDPDRAGVNNCRFSIGVVVNGNPELAQKLAKNGCVRVDNVSSKLKVLHSNFPFTGMLSVTISVFRIYSAFFREFKRLKIPSDGTKDGIFVEIRRPEDGIAEFFFTADDIDAFWAAVKKD